MFVQYLMAAGGADGSKTAAAPRRSADGGLADQSFPIVAQRLGPKLGNRHRHDSLEADRARRLLAAGAPLARTLTLRPRLAIAGFVIGILIMWMAIRYMFGKKK